uniref:DnaJ homolog subfamily C member 2 n=1 Tax=Spongospora subterranea TaxID=70186 RepID=A0A0H5R8C5_9EUKA|eukprot:CRZ10385.1 hypothetical protein [Spongospora subterranea]
MRLLIEYSAPCPEPIVLRSCSEFQIKNVEQAGRACHHRLHGITQSAVARKPVKKVAPKAAKRPVANLNVDLTDFYGLLQLKKTANFDEIRAAYRSISLIYHPDKNPDAEHVYKAIQEAHTTLTDIRRRRVYDSTLSFDDSIPADVSTITPEAFFKQFGPCFDRNAWFSEAQPAPLLGTAETSFDDVDNFYDFWFSFKSWRDFSADCEHKPELAENREERRWMEKENQKVTNAKVKAEAQRIRKIVDRAFKLDPRVKAQRAFEKEEKLRKKKEKTASRFGVQKPVEEDREALKQAEAAKATAEEEAKTAKKAAQDEKRLARTLRKSVRELISSNYNEIVERGGWLIDDLVQGLSNVQLNEFISKLQDSADAADAICGHIRRVYDGAQPSPDHSPVRPASKETPAPPAQSEESRSETPSTWSVQELHLLAQTCQRYPPGTPERWATIAKVIKGRSQEEVMEKAKSLAKGCTGGSAGATSQTKTTGLDGWSAAQHAQFEEALKQVPDKIHDRWAVIAKRVQGKTKVQCVERFKALRAQVLQAQGSV